MKVYMYAADLLCEECGELTKSENVCPGNPEDEHTFDSDDYPKGPYNNGGGEADCPQHCGHCNVFLENPLTDDGREYVREAIESHTSDVTKEWDSFYNT